jgi:hypothetical protein
MKFFLHLHPSNNNRLLSRGWDAGMGIKHGPQASALTLMLRRTFFNRRNKNLESPFLFTKFNKEIFLLKIISCKWTIGPTTESLLSVNCLCSEERQTCYLHFTLHLGPEIIDPVFVKTSPKHSFSITEYERLGLVFTNTRVYKFGHRTLEYMDVPHSL